ncbi:MAG: 2-iminoacetate synthase ThiH [Fervidobacterium sp.]
MTTVVKNTETDILKEIDKIKRIYLDYKNYIPSPREVLEILQKEQISLEDTAKLLNINDKELILLIAKKAQEITRRNFGCVIFLYTPLYVSNYCQNECLYCGFSIKNEVGRRKLNYEEVEEELKSIKNTGIDSVIILTGEDRNSTPFEYIKEVCRIATLYMSEVSIEVYPLNLEEYHELSKIGVVGITMYQETYQKDVYEELHVKGPKRDFLYRLTGIERAINAGFHEVCIGPLLGLGIPKLDVLITLAHSDYILNKYPKTELSISFPRFRNPGIVFSPKHSVSDKEFLKYLFVTRLYQPRAGIVLSTRENAKIRDTLIEICVTKMSAGSKTSVGGYTLQSKSISNNDEEYIKYVQFEVEDTRSVSEIIEVIKSKKLMPEFTNWVGGLVKHEF